MAKQRRNQAEETSTKKRMGTMAVSELTPDEIQVLLASSRTRGAYDQALDKFIKSDAPGVQVDLTDGEFKDKKPTSIMTGFKSAIARALKDVKEGDSHAAQNVRLIQNTEQVYLVRTDMT